MGSGGTEKGRVIEMGRWSEPRSVVVVQEERPAKEAGARERSGEDLEPEERLRRVGVSGSLRDRRGVPESQLKMAIPMGSLAL